MPRTPEQAEQWLRNKKTNVVDTCQLTMHEAYGVPSNGDATAYIDYQKSQHKFGPKVTPWLGVLHRWGPTPSNPDGHVAFGLGSAGHILSTDWPTAGHIGETTVEKLSDKWDNHNYLGFTSDVDGVVVAPKPKPPVPPKPEKVYHTMQFNRLAFRTAKTLHLTWKKFHELNPTIKRLTRLKKGQKVRIK